MWRENDTTGPVAMYLSERSGRSRRTMQFGLTTADEFFGGADPGAYPWHRVRVDRISALRADLASRFAPNTANKILSAREGVLRASWRMGLTTAEDLYRGTNVKPVLGGPRERGRALGKPERAALFRACAADPGPAGRRGRAVGGGGENRCWGTAAPAGGFSAPFPAGPFWAPTDPGLPPGAALKGPFRGGL